MSMDPGQSPNGSSDIRRLNRLPLAIVLAIIAIVLSGIIYAMYSRGQAGGGNRKKDDSPAVVGGSAMADKMLSGVGDGVADFASETVIIDNTQMPPETASSAASSPQQHENQQALPPESAFQGQEQEDEEAKRIAQMVREFRERNYYDALVARTAIEASAMPKRNTAQERDNREETGQQNIAALRQNLQTAAMERALGAQGIDGIESLLGERDPNLRVRKSAFAAQTDNPYGYLPSVREAQLTPYEIRVGTVISAVMVSGINSDLPGDIIAQVSHNVYDSRTGRTVLIPQGSKLIGRYDSHIAMGQKRVMIAWHRLQFPDASVFNLGNMGAVDPAGYAGIKDQVNNHSWEIFKNAFLLSVVGAGAQIAMGGSDSDDENNPRNVAMAELGRQFGQVGTEMIRRNLNIQPTLEIRPGYKFAVMVNKDLILPPYTK